MNTENSIAAIAAIALVALAMFFLIRRGKRAAAPAQPQAPAQPPAPAAPVTVTPLPDVAFNDCDPGIVSFADTGRQAGQTRHRLECDVVFDGFLEANTGGGKEGHLVIQTRSTLANIPAGNFRGIGWIAGSLWQGGDNPPFPFPGLTKQACCESWRNGQLPSPNWPWLKAASVSHPLEDGQIYRAVFTSEPAPGGWKYRFSIGASDSGDQIDDNTDIDPAEQAVAVAVIGEGRVSLTSIVSTWS